MRTFFTTAAFAACVACSTEVDIDVNLDDENSSSADAPPTTTTATESPDRTTDEDSTGLDTASSGSVVDSTDDSTTGTSTTEDTTGDQPGTGYGDCANNSCGLPEESCFFDGVRGVCAAPCETVTDCPPLELQGPIPDHPTPAVVACFDISGDGQGECMIDCTAGLTASCPEGMTGVNAGIPICMWPTFPVGGGSCPDIDLGGMLGAFAGDTTGLSDDVYRLCGFGGASDALLQWTAPSDGTYVFDTVGSSFDTVLAILASCEGPELACGNNQIGTFSQVTRAFAAGESVVIAVDSHLGQSGPFVLNIQQM